MWSKAFSSVSRKLTLVILGRFRAFATSSYTMLPDSARLLASKRERFGNACGWQSDRWILRNLTVPWSPPLTVWNVERCYNMLLHVHVVSEKLLSASKWLSASKCHRKFAKRGNVLSRSWSPWHFHSFLSWPSSTLRRRPRSWTRFSEPKDTEGHGFRILKDAISDVIWCDIWYSLNMLRLFFLRSGFSIQVSQDFDFGVTLVT